MGEILLFSITSKPDPGASLAFYTMGTEGCFPGDRAAGGEADHSRPSSAEVKNGGAIPPLPLPLHGMVLN
jgi:hypothetical protein